MKEPLFRIIFKLRKLTLNEQCSYLIACRNVEAEGGSRRRELDRLLIDCRTRQIRHEMRKAS